MDIAPSLPAEMIHVSHHCHSTKPFFIGTMPLPPSVNASYKIVQSRAGVQRVGSTADLEQFKRDAALMLADLNNTIADWDFIELLRHNRHKTPLFVRLDIYFLWPWKRDVDGPAKYAVDAAFARIGLNDRLITSLYAVKHVDAKRPRVEIAISCDLSSR